VNFETEVDWLGEDLLYMLLIGWQIRSLTKPFGMVFSSVAFTRSHLCWEGLVLHKEQRFLRTKTCQAEAFQTLAWSEVQGAECSKGAYWPERQNFWLIFEAGPKSQSFEINNAIGFAELSEAVAALRNLGVPVVDRHDIFWEMRNRGSR
jgi:hypothetical protein